MKKEHLYKEVSEVLGLGGEVTSSIEIKVERLLSDLKNGRLKCKDHGEVINSENFGGLFWGDLLCKKAFEEREQFLFETSKI